MTEAPQVNPFVVAGELAAEDMIDRDRETADLLARARAGQPFRLVGPRRYGKTTLLARALGEADAEGMATALVDLELEGRSGISSTSMTAFSTGTPSTSTSPASDDY